MLVRFLLVLAVSVSLSQAMAAESKTKDDSSVVIRQSEDGDLKIELTSSRRFPVVGAMPVLSIGEASSNLSGYPDGNLKRIVFRMSAVEFEKAKDGDLIEVRYKPDSQGHWDFGRLDKSKVRK